MHVVKGDCDDQIKRTEHELRPLYRFHPKGHLGCRSRHRPSSSPLQASWGRLIPPAEGLPPPRKSPAADLHAPCNTIRRQGRYGYERSRNGESGIVRCLRHAMFHAFNPIVRCRLRSGCSPMVEKYLITLGAQVYPNRSVKISDYCLQAKLFNLATATNQISVATASQIYTAPRRVGLPEQACHRIV